MNEKLKITRPCDNFSTFQPQNGKCLRFFFFCFSVVLAENCFLKNKKLFNLDSGEFGNKFSCDCLSDIIHNFWVLLLQIRGNDSTGTKPVSVPVQNQSQYRKLKSFFKPFWHFQMFNCKCCHLSMKLFQFVRNFLVSKWKSSTFSTF